MKINKDLNERLKRRDFKINFENIRKNISFIFSYVFSIKRIDGKATKTIVSKKLISFNVDEGPKGSSFRFDFKGKTDKSETLIIEVCGNFEVLNSDLKLKFQYYDYMFLNTLYLEVEQIPKNEQLLNEI